MSRNVWACLPVIGLTLSFSTAVFACNVPVFRYALEHWRTDPYRLTVFHSGSLSEGDQALIASLESKREKSLANVTVRMIDVDATVDSADQELFHSLQNPTFPWLLAEYPAHLKSKLPCGLAR